MRQALPSSARQCLALLGLSLGLAAQLGCGSVEGQVYGADTTAASRVPDVDVLLVRRSSALLASLKQFCLDEKADEARRDAERARLTRKAHLLKDSAAVIFGLEYQSPRWQRVMAAANAASDSSDQMSILGNDPVAVAEENALQRARTDGSGHYRLTSVRAGSYFVVPLVRESASSPVLWYPTRVVIGTKRLDVNGDDGWAGCYLTKMDSIEASARR
jgi:hypothetical protein